MIEWIILNLKEANWVEFSVADEKLRRVLGIKHRICKYNDYHELGHVETKGIEI